MAQRSRSFTEYVKHHLDNQLWNALEEYLSNLDSSALQLRLRSISDVGEFELYDTEIQFVNVSNLPGSNIAFDVVLDATLIVYDTDRYHNDKSEVIHIQLPSICSVNFILKEKLYQRMLIWL